MTTRTMKAMLLAGGIMFAASPLMADPECEQYGHIAGELVVERIPFLRDGIGYIEEDNVVYCSRCGAELGREMAGEPQLCKHDGTTSIRDAREPTCTSLGYTGDKVCDICGMVLEEGLELAALGHDIGPGVVTKAPTTTEEGVLSYICAHCGEVVYTEPIPKLEPDPEPEPEPPCYEALDAKDVTAPYAAPKAVVLRGVAYDGCDAVGIVELKLGKVNKKGTSKVSGSFTGLDGKKLSIKAATVTDVDGTMPATVSLEVKNLGTMTVKIGGTQFAGSLGGWHVQSGAVGGDWTGRGATVGVDAGDVSMFAGTVLTDLLPNDEQATANGGKWAFKKAAGVKWAKPKKGAEPPEIYDEESGKGLIVDTSKDKTNLSGLKLTYTPKKGTFKGSFKVYALEGEGKATKLKKYTVKVNGVVVDGVGYGTAMCKKPAASWPVTVR